MEDLIKLAILKEILSERIPDEDEAFFDDEDASVHGKRCRTLQDILQQYGIDSEVSRSHIGKQNFYNIEMNVHVCDVPVNLFMRHLFDIDEVGLVSMFDDQIVVLIDEDALHERYLVDNALDFSGLDPHAHETFDMIEAVKRDMSLMG